MYEIHSNVLTVEAASISSLILNLSYMNSTWMRRLSFLQELQQGDISLYGVELTFRMERLTSKVQSFLTGKMFYGGTLNT